MSAEAEGPTTAMADAREALMVASDDHAKRATRRSIGRLLPPSETQDFQQAGGVQKLHPRIRGGRR